jgi:arylsulfatase A-like enzyme
MIQRSEFAAHKLPYSTALGTGLTLGSLDALVDLSVRSSNSASPLSTWTALGVSTLAGFLLHLLLWALSSTVQRFAPILGARAWAVAAASLTLALPTLLSCYRAVDPTPRSSLLAVPAALAVAVGVYWIARPFTAKAGGTTVAVLFSAWTAAAALGAAGLLALSKAGWLAGPAQQGPALLGLLALLFFYARWAWRTTGAMPAVYLQRTLFLGSLVLGGMHLIPDSSAEISKGRPPAGRKPRHVILVVVDTLRADYLSCYSEAAPPTPEVDGLAAKSLFFENPRSSAPWTFPSVSSILTGLAPSVHLGLRPFDALPRSVKTLAARMSEAGFLTAAFVRNPALRRYTEIDRGFDEYHYQREPHPPSALAEVLLRGVLPDIYLAQVGAGIQSRRAAQWIADHKDRDFFLWIHYFDPHMAYNPPREFQPEGTPPAQVGRNFEDAARVRGGFFNPDASERQWIRDLYAGEVRATDRDLGGLFRALNSEGLMEDCTLVFTADHGDELWEHDAFEHGHTMYDEVLGVPLFMKLPGGALAGRVSEPVSNQSVAATILEVAGVPYREAELSAPPLVRRSGPDGDLTLDVQPRPLVANGILYFEARSAVVFEGFKFIKFRVSKREELYDLASDPGEQKNLAEARPDLVARGRALLEEELTTAERMRRELGIESATSGPLDDDTARAMRALGYVK